MVPAPVPALVAGSSALRIRVVRALCLLIARRAPRRPVVGGARIREFVKAETG